MLSKYRVFYELKLKSSGCPQSVDVVAISASAAMKLFDESTVMCRAVYAELAEESRLVPRHDGAPRTVTDSMLIAGEAAMEEGRRNGKMGWTLVKSIYDAMESAR